MTTTIDDLLASWVPVKQVPFYVASQNKIAEIDKRRILIGFRSEGEPQTVEGNSEDLIDLRLTLTDFEEERQKTFIALSSGKIVATSGPKRDLRFRWIKKSFWSSDPGSKIMTALTEDPSVNVLRRQPRWLAAIVVNATSDNLDHVYELQVLLVKSTNGTEEPLYWKSVCTYSLVNQFQINEHHSLIDDKKSFMGGNYLIECSLTTKSQCLARLKESIANKTLFYRKNGLMTLLDSVWTVLSGRPDSIKGFADSYLAVVQHFLANEGSKVPNGLQAFINDTTANRSSFELSELFELYLNENNNDAATDLFEKQGLTTSLLDGYVPFPVTNENFLIKIEKTIANWQSLAVTVKEVSFVDVLYAVYLKSGYGLNKSPSEALYELTFLIYALPFLLERFFSRYSEEIFDEINLRHGKIDAISDDETDFPSFFKRDVLFVRTTHDYYHDFEDVSTDAALVVVTKITTNDSLVLKYPTYTNAPLLKPKTVLVSQKTSFSPYDLIENERIFDDVDGIVLGDFLRDKETWIWCKPTRRGSKRGIGSSELNLVEDFSSTYFLEIDPTDDENESYYELWLVSDLLLKTTVPSCDVITKQLIVSVTVRTPLSVEKRVKANSKNGENAFSYKMRLPSNQRLITVIKSDEDNFRSLEKDDATFPVLRNDKYRSEEFANGSDKNLIKLTRVFDESDDSSFYSAVIDSDLQEIFLDYWKNLLFPKVRFPDGKPPEDQKVRLLRHLFEKRYGRKKNYLEYLVKQMSAKNPKISLTLGGLEETTEDYLINDKLRLSFSLAKGSLHQTRDKRFLSDETVFFVYRSVLMDKVYSMFRNSVRYEGFGPFEDLYYGGFIDHRTVSQTIEFVKADLRDNVNRNQYEISAKAKKAFLFACVEEFGPSLRTSWYKNVEEKWNEPSNASESRKMSLLSDFCSLHAKTLEDVLVKLFRDNVSRWWRSILDGSVFSFKFSKSPLPPPDLPPSNVVVRPSRSTDYDALIESQTRELEKLDRDQSEEAKRTVNAVLEELNEEFSTVELSSDNVSKLLLEKKKAIHLSRIVQRATMEETLKRQLNERYEFLSNDLKESYDADRRIAAVKNDVEEIHAVIELHATNLELLKNERERKTRELENRLENDHREEDETDAALVSDLKALDIDEAKDRMRTNNENLELKWFQIVKPELDVASPDEILDLLINKTLVEKEREKAHNDAVFVSNYERTLDARKDADYEREMEEEEKKRESEREREDQLRSLEEKKREEDENRRINEELRRHLELTTEEAKKMQEKLREAEEKLRQRQPERPPEEGGVAVPGVSLEQLELDKKERERLQAAVAELQTLTKEIEEKRRLEELETVKTREALEEMTKRKEQEEIERRERAEKDLASKREEELLKAERKRQKEETARMAKEEATRKTEEMEKQLEILRTENENIRREQLEAQKKMEEELERIAKEREEFEARLLENDKIEREGEDELDRDIYALPSPPPLTQSTTAFATSTVSTTTPASTPTKMFVPRSKSAEPNLIPFSSPMTKGFQELTKVFSFQSPEQKATIADLKKFVSDHVTDEFKPNPLRSLSSSSTGTPSPSFNVGEKHPLYFTIEQTIEETSRSTRGEGTSESALYSLRAHVYYLFLESKIVEPLKNIDPSSIENSDSLIRASAYVTNQVSFIFDQSTTLFFTMLLHEKLSDYLTKSRTSNKYDTPDNALAKLQIVLSDYLRLKYVVDVGTCFGYNPHFFWFPDNLETKITEYESDPNYAGLKFFTSLFENAEDYDIGSDPDASISVLTYVVARTKRFVGLKKICRALVDDNYAIATRIALIFVFYYEILSLNWLLNRFLTVSLDNCFKNVSEVYPSSGINSIKIFASDARLISSAKAMFTERQYNVPSYLAKQFTEKTVENYAQLLTTPSGRNRQLITKANENLVSINDAVKEKYTSSLYAPTVESRKTIFVDATKTERKRKKAITDADSSCVFAILMAKEKISNFVFRPTKQGWLEGATANTDTIVAVSKMLVDALFGPLKLEQNVRRNLEEGGFSLDISFGMTYVVPVDRYVEWDAMMAIPEFKSSEFVSDVLIGPRADLAFDARGHDEPNRTANFPPVVTKSYSSFDDCLTIFKILYELNPEWIFREDVLPSLKTRSWKIKVLKTDGSTGELYEESENAWGTAKWSFFKEEIASEPIKRELYDRAEDNHEKKRENDIVDSLIIRKSIVAVEKINNKMPFLAILLRLQKHSDLLSSGQYEILNGLIFEVKRFVDADQSLFGMGLYKSDMEPCTDYVSELLDVYEKFETRRISFEFTTKEDERVLTLPKMDAVEFLKRTCGRKYKSFRDKLHEKSRSAFEQTFEEFMVAYPQVRLLMYCYFYYKVNDGAKPKIVYSIYREREFLSYVSKNNRASSMEKFDIEDALISVPMYTKNGIDYSIQMIVDSEDKGWFLREMGAKFWDAAFERSTVVDNTTVNFIVEDKGSFLYGLSLWGKYALGMTRSEIAGLPMTRKFFGNVDVIGSASIFEMNSLVADESKPAIYDVVAATSVPKFTKRRTPKDGSDIASSDEYEALSEFVCIGKRETRLDYRNALRKFDALANLDRILTDFFVLARGNETEERKIVKRYKAKDVYDNGTLVIKM